jgi:hypothetical protein
MAVAYAMEEQGSRPTIQHVTPQTSDEIVVTGRRPEEAPEAVEDTVTSATIKSLGTNSIGELLARLRARYAGGELAIIVNGRRLASIDALSEFPPEALKQIDVLRPGSGSQFGYPATDRVLNLVLRPTFSSVTVEGAASATTEGGGDDGNIAARHARIRGDRRTNGSVVYRQAGGLREDERADPASTSGSVGAAGDSAGARYRSLIPASRDLTATAGIALPVRAANLDLSATGGATETRALAGLFHTASDTTIAAESAAGYVQQGRTTYLRGSATLGGPWHRMFWSILMNGDVTRSDNETKRGRAVSPGPIDPPDRSLSALPLAPVSTLTSSLSQNLAIRALVNGPVARLPTGDIRVGSTVSASGNRFRNRVSGSPVDPVTVSSTLMNAQVNADIPIANRDVAALAWLGNVMLNVSAEYGKLSGFAGAPAAQATLNWAISRSVTLSYSRNYRRSPPVPAQLYAPVIALPGRLIYDERGGGITPVTLIGPRLRAHQQRLQPLLDGDPLGGVRVGDALPDCGEPVAAMGQRRAVIIVAGRKCASSAPARGDPADRRGPSDRHGPGARRKSPSHGPRVLPAALQRAWLEERARRPPSQRDHSGACRDGAGSPAHDGDTALLVVARALAPQRIRQSGGDIERLGGRVAGDGRLVARYDLRISRYRRDRLALFIRRHPGRTEVGLTYGVDPAFGIGFMCEAGIMPGGLTSAVHVRCRQRPHQRQAGGIGEAIHLLLRDGPLVVADMVERPGREGDMRMDVPGIALGISAVDCCYIGQAQPPKGPLAEVLDERVALVRRKIVRQVPDDAILDLGVGAIALLHGFEHAPSGGDLLGAHSHVGNRRKGMLQSRLFLRAIAQDVEDVIRGKACSPAFRFQAEIADAEIDRDPAASVLDRRGVGSDRAAGRRPECQRAMAMFGFRASMATSRLRPDVDRTPPCGRAFACQPPFGGGMLARILGCPPLPQCRHTPDGAGDRAIGGKEPARTAVAVHQQPEHLCVGACPNPAFGLHQHRIGASLASVPQAGRGMMGSECAG